MFLRGRAWIYSSLPCVGKPPMVVVMVQGAPCVIDRRSTVGCPICKTHGNSSHDKRSALMDESDEDRTYNSHRFKVNPLGTGTGSTLPRPDSFVRYRYVGFVP